MILNCRRWSLERKKDFDCTTILVLNEKGCSYRTALFIYILTTELYSYRIWKRRNSCTAVKLLAAL